MRSAIYPFPSTVIKVHVQRGKYRVAYDNEGEGFYVCLRDGTRTEHLNFLCFDSVDEAWETVEEGFFEVKQ